MAVVTSQATNPQDNPLVGFGPNEWIVEDMYQRYLADPNSVDPAWHDFFADYRPVPTEPATAAASKAPSPAPAPSAPAQEPPAAPAPAAVPAPASTAPASSAPASTAPASTAPAKPRPSLSHKPPSPDGQTHTAPIRGVAAKIVSNMDASLQVPTATSVRAVPAKLLADNRIVINNHLARGRGGKVSFTHSSASRWCRPSPHPR
jgi:2-oxoglutarate dehydrogenase E1 component